MSRPLPRSLAGQMILLLGVALLVAQLANFALILNERQKLGLAEIEGPAITRFAGVANNLQQARPEFAAAVIADGSHRGARFALAPTSGIDEAARDKGIEAKLVEGLAEAGAAADAVRATIETAPPRRSAGDRPTTDRQILRLAAQREDGEWLTARIVTPRRDPLLTARLAAATLLLYLLVLGASIWLTQRIARPLGALTRAAERFQGRSDPVVVEPSGPEDLRQAIEAFNAMNQRVIALLDEKDRMLGAIGHDLRTPLASLRIRVEGMEPELEREAAVAKIAEMTAMLEDILVLARSGRAREEVRLTNVTALVEAVVEDYAALAQPVRFVASNREVLSIQPALVRRALRNLIDNAVTYGGSAAVAVISNPETVEVSVTDNGPGIPAGEIEKVLQPFYRVEKSRSRTTGGSGLGLSIANSVAQSHAGHLKLREATPHGLIATLVVPRSVVAQPESVKSAS